MPKYKREPGARIHEHRAIAQRILGRPLKSQEQIHHVNHDGLDNTLSNLVICPDVAYHRLLHARERALDACGNANWKICNICGKYSDPATMQPHDKNDFVHYECSREMQRQRRRFRGDEIRARDNAYYKSHKAARRKLRRIECAKAGAFIDSFYRREAWL